MISKHRYRPLRSYLDGGRSDVGWSSAKKKASRERTLATVTSGLEVDARRACHELLKVEVERAIFPHASPTRSIRLHLKDRNSVIATRRATPGRAELEVGVLQALHARGAQVPKVLAFDGTILLQEDLGNAWLTRALKRADSAEGEKLLDAGLESLARAHQVAAEAGLAQHVVTLGESAAWRRAFISHTRSLGEYLAMAPPRLQMTRLIERLAVKRPAFVKWDARPPNAIALDGGQIAWIDWEHCGRRNSVDDLAWFFGDQTVPDWPDVEERLLERFVPIYVDGNDVDDAHEYLAVFGTFHMCYRIGKILNRARKDVVKAVDPEKTGNWRSVMASGQVSADALMKAHRTAGRASRWAARSSLTAPLSPWLSEMAELFQTGNPELKDRSATGKQESVRVPIKLAERNDSNPASVPALVGSRVFWGHNIHHDATVICQEIAFGKLAQLTSSAAGPDFASRFLSRFGGLKMLNAGDEIKPDFLQRLESADGVPFTELLLQAILSVEGSLAFAMSRLDPVGFAKVIDGEDSLQALLTWRCREPNVSRRSASVALAGLKELLPNELVQQESKPDEAAFQTAYDDLVRHTGNKRLDYNTMIMLQAAERRGIPWDRLRGRFTRLGQGKFQQHIMSSATENTSFIAQRLSVNKRITQVLLRDAGVPVPQQRNALSVEDALESAERIGYPVVLKPLDGSSGRGVTANIKSAEEIPAAFEIANELSRNVIVETFIEGQDHRLLVVDGRFVAGTKRVAASVTGDGRRSIGELLQSLNDDPRRDGFTLIRVDPDDDLKRLLHRANYSLDTVLARDEKFVLRSIANYHAGGTTIDITDEVHPDNAEMAILAAEAMGLDLAGVDLVMPDITQSYKQVGGGIIEVNARPGIDLHTKPAEGKPRDAAGAIIEAIYPQGNQGRVPVTLVVGARGATAVARLLGNILQATNRTTGVVTIREATVNGERLDIAKFRRRQAISRVLHHPRLEVLVDSTSATRIANNGLIHDACEITAIMPDIGDPDNETTRQGLAVLVAATRGKIVVAGDNELVLAAVSDIEPGRLVLVAQQENEAITQHRKSGGETAIVQQVDGVDEIVIFASKSKPASFTLKTRGWRQTRSKLFAIILARHLGVEEEAIRAGLARS